jgi:signal transduction histidine kinase
LFEVPFWLFALATGVALLVADRFRRRWMESRRRMDALLSELEAAREEIVSAERMRTEILSRIGGALRKPLASIRTAVEEVTRPLECPDWMKEQLGLLGNEVENVSRFINLIGELATREDVTPPDAGASSAPEAVDLESLVSDVLQAASGRLTEKGISLAVSMDPGVRARGDERHFRQAVESLLDESIRNAGRGSVLCVDLSSNSRTARLVLDYRGPSDTESVETALGTELARQILGANGGWLHEGARKGQFTAGLPLGIEDSGTDEEEEDEGTDIQEI